MKYAHQFLVTTVSLIAIVPLLAVPAEAGEIHGDQTGTNLSLGTNTLTNLTTGSYNTVIGNRALSNNTEGNHNTASGTSALHSNTEGNHNTAVGSDALHSNTEGNNNTASGYYALKKNTTGYENTASGAAALLFNTTGSGNTATGNLALSKSRGADANTATGNRALYQNTSGSRNAATGASVLERNTRGSFNAAFGTEALRNNRNGSRNTAVGFRAGGRNNGSGNIFIGHEAGYNNLFRNVSNKLIIANGHRSTDALVIGDFSSREVNIMGDLHASGYLTQSDARLKKDIQPLTHALDAILQLQGKTYRWKEDTTFANKKDIGLVAQEVEKVFPELVAENEQGYKGIAYSKLTAVLIEAMKEQQGQMATQQAQITALEKENTQLKAIVEGQMEDLLARVAMLEGVSLVTN